MDASEKIDKLSEALNRAQSKIGGAVKDAANPFFKSKYADLSAVIKAFKGPMIEEGLSYVQHPVSNEYGVGVVTRLMHTSGQWLEASFTVPLVKLDPQQAGSAITYCRRYALAAMFGIPQVDDDANAATFVTEESSYTPEQLEYFQKVMRDGDHVGAAYIDSKIAGDAMTDLYNSFPKGKKTNGKQEFQKLVRAGHEYIEAVYAELRHLVTNGDVAALQHYGELDKQERYLLSLKAPRELIEELERELRAAA